MFPSVLLLSYVLLSAGDCVRAERGKSRFLKPLLMPLLAFFYTISCTLRGTVPEIMVVAALLFSALGDIFLIFHTRLLFQLLGTVSFALAHITYGVAFLSLLRGAYPSLKDPALPVFVIVYVFLLVFFYRFLNRDLSGVYRLFVFVYAVLILFMSFTALLRLYVIRDMASVSSFAGSLLFLLSDFLLALHFFKHMKYHGVMETYLAAQLLIVVSFLP